MTTSCERPLGLTEQQRRAVGAPELRLSIAAGPGTGKTTVSAHRFGVLRFAEEHREDPRAVLAVSFTRAATTTLRKRIQRLWGSHALRWPHGVTTLDALMGDVIHDLLKAGLLAWPGGRTELEIEDSWDALVRPIRSRNEYALTVGTRGGVTAHCRGLPKMWTVVNPNEVIRLIKAGTCTHGDVRAVLEQALELQPVQEFVKLRLAQRFRALIVDEVYDANDLDIRVLQLAVEAGVSVTLVGDIWQALYVFRGARPEAIPRFIEDYGFRTVRLDQSFRWISAEQEDLAKAARGGHPTLPLVGRSAMPELDVVLCSEWVPLWSLGEAVLPIGFKSFKGGYEESAAILILNHVTQSLFNVEAAFLRDALRALAITDPEFQQNTRPRIQEIVDALRGGGDAGVRGAYALLSALVAEYSPRTLRPIRANHTRRLAAIQERLDSATRPVIGLTIHQAKGAEWDQVGVCLTDDDRATMATQLSVEGERDRKLYVALTRARARTVEVVANTGARTRV